MKATKILLAAAALSLATAGSALAFHNGGVAYCDGCHTMHNSSGNLQMNNINGTAGTGQFQGKNYLLKGTDDSSTCLNCHASSSAGSYHIMTNPAPAAGAAPINYTPGGDFAWLKINLAQPAGSHSGASPGERHGHNVVAADFALVADTTLTTAPGGSYSASALSCASCHDPHARARIEDSATGVITYPTLGSAVKPIGVSGSYGGVSDAEEATGVYRILAGSNYSQMSYTNPLPFNADPPVAVAPSTYNRNESTADTRVAYGKNMSEWCANCHRSIHNGNVNAANTALIHPAGNTALLTATANDLAGNANGTTIANLYNKYKSSGDLSGTVATSYDSLVPYEAGTGIIADLAALSSNDGSITTGPSTGTENVMCLSCHRAHATAFNSMTRWSNTNEFLTTLGAWPGTDQVDAEAIAISNGMSQAQYQAAMYGKPATKYAYVQRSLCNKCHAKD
jgi:hypothetical protein